MNDIILVTLFSLIGGLFSLIGGLMLLHKRTNATKVAIYGTPFAAGALLAAVFIDLLPEGVSQSSADTVLLMALVGILLFFFAERFLRWFHHHHEDDVVTKKDPSLSLIVVGDTLHNALDGVAIAAAFLVSVPTGIVTTIAVAAHEIPQEIGDFALLLAKGVDRKRVIMLNILSSLATTFTAVIVYVLGDEQTLPVGVLLGLSAGFLLYIALSDIIPTIHAKTDASKLLHVQSLLLLVGVVVVGLAIWLAHDYIDVAHAHTETSAQQQKNDEHHHQDAANGASEHGH